MSRNVIVGKRYAKALFLIAQERNQVSEVEAELKLVAEAITEHPELKQIWEHTTIAASAKKEMLQQIFASGISETVLNTMYLLVDKSRENVFTELLNSYVSLAHKALGQVQAIVYSPMAMSDEEKQHIAVTFGSATGKKVVVDNIIKPDLLGGLKVRIGDRLYDGSSSGKLQRLNKLLSQ